MSEPTENYAIAGYLFDHDPGGAVKVYRANDPILADWKRSHDALGKLGGVVKEKIRREMFERWGGSRSANATRTPDVAKLSADLEAMKVLEGME